MTHGLTSVQRADSKRARSKRRRKADEREQRWLQLQELVLTAPNDPEYELRVELGKLLRGKRINQAQALRILRAYRAAPGAKP